MCFFEFKNTNAPRALVKGIDKFSCGHCPECLQKKSRLWALRCGMEAKDNVGMMITLTYDTYKYDERIRRTDPGKALIENPTNPDIPLSKRDCQLFIKRLRKYAAKKDLKIKYILTAERGKRTGRSHYHALIFGIVFDDLIKYKKSDRGNWIYKSKVLEKIWQKGICTVDCINLSAKVARYCTKYCAKDAGAEDTFMLFSRGVGDRALQREFDGKSYWIDGREYSIPRQIWQRYIERKYRIKGYSRYVPRVNVEQNGKKCFNEILRYQKRSENRIGYNADLQIARALSRARKRLELNEKRYQEGVRKREIYSLVRDNDSCYVAYLEYWHNKAEVYKITQPSVFSRILALPDDKYRSYKNHAILSKRKQNLKKEFIPPRSYTQAFMIAKAKKIHVEKSFAPLPCHYRANDTTRKQYAKFMREQAHQIYLSMERNAAKADVVLDPFVN